MKHFTSWMDAAAALFSRIIREARVSAFAMRKNNDKLLLQICLGFSYNWHVLDIIAYHNRPRKGKNAFRG